MRKTAFITPIFQKKKNSIIIIIIIRISKKLFKSSDLHQLSTTYLYKVNSIIRVPDSSTLNMILVL